MIALPSKFKEQFGRMPRVISSAPGRINIIGEHTDYNGGYVLPAAIDRRIHFLAAPRRDDKVVLWAENFGEKAEFSLKNLEVSSGKRWADYVQGIFWVLEKEGHCPGGIDGFIFGDVPLASGLSSSAALEVSAAVALTNLFSLAVAQEKIPLFAQRAENEYVGVECGVMDQYISVFGKKGKALFLDCASLDHEYVPLPLVEHRKKFFVIDSRVRRQLASSEYNKRREECRAAAKILGEDAAGCLRDVSDQKLKEKKTELGEILFRRARHVISENERVIGSRRALESADFVLLGKFLNGSHRSLRDDFEVSCPELDLLYALGREYEGCLGARLTGAGFGGSGIALLEEDKVSGFVEKVKKTFAEDGYKVPSVFEIGIDDGAFVL